MANNEQTSARIAAIAARGVKNPASLTLAEIKEVCASVLTQAPDKASGTIAGGAHKVYR